MHIKLYLSTYRGIYTQSLTLYTFTSYEVGVTEICREEVVKFGEVGIANLVAVTLELTSVRTN